MDVSTVSPHAPWQRELAALRPCLLRYASFRLVQRECAEDLVQDTLLALLQHEGRFERRCALRTYAISVLRYKLLDCLRERRRQARLFHHDAQPLIDDSAALAASAEPEILCARHQWLRALAHELAALAPRKARLFAMYYLDGETAQTIGECLGISTGNVWVSLHRLRRQCLPLGERHWL